MELPAPIWLFLSSLGIIFFCLILWESIRHAVCAFRWRKETREDLGDDA
jgi:hypothetical protein